LQPGSAAAGERLFSGAVRFANGGPPCLSCHDVAGLTFPHGGVLGPDLTGSWAKYGPLALAPVLNTLYFPTMVPIFTTRPLTPAERGDLAAFLRAEAGKVPATGATVELLALGSLGVAVLLVLAWLAWPRRLRGVRRGLLERVGPPEGLHP
jgi:mono/diheme cytochrome c family protein